MSECFLGRSRFNQCCCNCKSQLKHIEKPKYVCIVMAEKEGIYFPIDKHSCGCEMYDSKGDKPLSERNG